MSSDKSLPVEQVANGLNVNEATLTTATVANLRRIISGRPRGPSKRERNDADEQRDRSQPEWQKVLSISALLHGHFEGYQLLAVGN